MARVWQELNLFQDVIRFLPGRNNGTAQGRALGLSESIPLPMVPTGVPTGLPRRLVPRHLRHGYYHPRMPNALSHHC